MGRNIEREEGDKGVVRRWFEGRSEGVFRRLAANKVVLNYTHLHAFTRLYTKFLGVNVTDINDAEITTETPRHRGETDWPQTNTENAKGVGNVVPEYWGGKREGVLEYWSHGVREETMGRIGRMGRMTPMLDRITRRKWLISRLSDG